MTIERITLAKRLTSMFIDHIFMTVLVAVFSIPLFLYVFSDPFNVATTHSQTYNNLMYLTLLAMSLYFCKDCLNGQSFAKRRLGLQVVDNKTDKVASPIKCFIRDMFIVLFPVEVIVALSNPHRRIGDIVAGTKLVTVSSAVTSKNNQYVQASLCVILSFAIYVAIYRLTRRL